jgi:hypothetical protein
VHSIAWFANSLEFLSIETNEAVHINAQGRILDQHPFERYQLHDAAITKDAVRFFVVATLECTTDGFKPINARAEKRMIVYNRMEKKIEA